MAKRPATLRIRCLGETDLGTVLRQALLPQAVLLQVLLLSALVLGACIGPKSASGFRLPDGDPAKGQQEFVELGCHVCHLIDGVESPQMEVGPDVQVRLGGQVSRVKTYGDLVTSIINPSHRFAAGYPPERVRVDGESRMTVYNDHMTVQQLVDLVAFLSSKYEVKAPDYEYVPFG